MSSQKPDSLFGKQGEWGAIPRLPGLLGRVPISLIWLKIEPNVKPAFGGLLRSLRELLLE